MNTASVVLLVVAAFASVIGTAIMLKSLRTSPEGFEDIEGFHHGHSKIEIAREPVRAGTLEHQSAA
jgi:hypothetical protein